VSDAVLPELIVLESGWVVILGLTEIVDNCESIVPTELVTRTQYVAVSVKEGVVKLEELVPTGIVVTPNAPRYH
jgi:UV DNA damage repair endonuclease